MSKKKGPAGAAPKSKKSSERVDAQLRAKKEAKGKEVEQAAVSTHSTGSGPTAEALPAERAKRDVLSPKQEKFCQNFLIFKTATEAYKDAYGNTKSAEAAASRLLTSVKVQTRIKALQQEAARGAVLSREQILQYLTRVVMTPIGTIDDSSELCQAWEYEIFGGPRGKLKRGQADEGNEEIEDERTLVKVKMPDKLRAIETFGKLQGMFAAEKKDVNLR